MARQYTKVQILSEEVFARKEAGETHREIAESYGLSKKQISKLVERERLKQRKIAAGYVPKSKGRPRKTQQSEDAQRNQEVAKLRMEIELLRNFLSEVGRR